MKESITRQQSIAVYFESNAGTRREVVGEDHFLIVPVVMMTEGVRNSVLYDENVLKRFANNWDGRPVTIDHPKENGAHVSASKSPKIMQEFAVGFVQNAKYDSWKDSGGKKRNGLRAEAWINVTTMEAKHVAHWERMTANGAQIDVSIGVFTEEKEELGSWSGKEFEHVVLDTRADHLAILTDKPGACSWGDGCGIRMNENEDDPIPMDDDLAAFDEDDCDDCGIGCTDCGKCARARARVRERIAINEIGNVDIEQEINNQIQQHESVDENHFVFVHAVFPKRVIYEVLELNNENKTEEECLFERSLKVNRNKETVVVNAECFPIKRKVTYTRKNNIGLNMERNELIAEVRTNDLYSGEESQAFLESLDDDKLQAVSDSLNKEEIVPPPTEPTVNDASDYIEKMDAPDTIKSMFRKHVAVEQQKRTDKISLIVNDARNKFDEDYLTTLSDDQLDGIAALATTVEETPAAPTPAHVQPPARVLKSIGESAATPVLQSDTPDVFSAPPAPSLDATETQPGFVASAN